MNADSHDIADLLRSRPTQWALIRSYASFNSVKARAKQIRRAGVTAFAPSGSFEASVRRVNGGEFLLFARYVGDDPRPARRDVEVPEGFSFVSELPPPAGKVDDPSHPAIVAYLRSHPAGQRTLRAGLTVRQAQRLASRVRSGDMSAFRPAGTYDAHIERDSTGRWAVRVTLRKLVIPEVKRAVSPREAGWIEGVAWYQDHLGGDLVEMQKVVDRFAERAASRE